MATLTIRNLDDDVRDRLRRLAAENGRSMEAEARAILKRASLEVPAAKLGTRVAARFADIGGVEFDDLRSREAPRAADLT